MNNKIIIGIIILIIILGAGYIGVKKYRAAMRQANTPPQAMQQTSPTQAIHMTPSTAMTTQQITVEGNEFAFNPATLTVKMGQPVTIVFKNTGKYPHNLTIADLNVQTKTIQAGQSDTITFSPSKVGSFTYVCTVPGHADKGMKGTITVQ